MNVEEMLTDWRESDDEDGKQGTHSLVSFSGRLATQPLWLLSPQPHTCHVDMEPHSETNSEHKKTNGAAESQIAIDSTCQPLANSSSESKNQEQTSRQDTKPKDYFECNICLETASEPVLTPCGHLFW